MADNRQSKTNDQSAHLVPLHQNLRDRKLAKARQRRQEQRQVAREPVPAGPASNLAIDFVALRTPDYDVSRAATPWLLLAELPWCGTTQPVLFAWGPRPAPAASPSSWRSKFFTASSAHDPAMPSTSGLTPRVKPPTMLHLTSANASTYRYPSVHRKGPQIPRGTESRHP